MPERLLSAAACAEIAARAAKATAGPWQAEVALRDWEDSAHWQIRTEMNQAATPWSPRFIAWMNGAAHISPQRFAELSESERAQLMSRGVRGDDVKPDADFIAAAREDIPALLRTVAALRETVGLLLLHLPDKGPQQSPDWEWAWNELSAESQDAVREIRYRAIEVYEAVR